MNKAEIEHALFGIGIIAMALTALWAWHRPRSPACFLWPVFAALIGANLLFPAETGVGHYEPAGWWQTIRDLYPVDIEAWLAALSQFHVIQHKSAGMLTLFIAGVEFGRSAGALKASFWGRLLPYFSIAIGLVISIHGGTAEHLPNPREQLHHWIFGICFVSGGTLLALHQGGRIASTRWRDGWAILVLVAGVDLAFFYSL